VGEDSVGDPRGGCAAGRPPPLRHERTAKRFSLSTVRLEGKNALVTGGASGIGAATARRLAAEGARVAIGDLNEDGARSVAGELDGFACLLDVTDTGSVRTAVAATREALGEIDVLVNNAGTDLFSYFVNSDEGLWDFVLGVNLRGVLAVTHAVLPSMQERRTGAIVNVASEAGRVGSQGSAVYSAAKAGVIGFTKAIARESARYRVRCNAVAPGPIETPLLNAAPQLLGELGERLKQGMVNTTVMGRSGEPEEVAAAIAFLASEDASYVTGQTLNVSGGLSMW
jgi:2-hydroxycyclohexanecarboxyl-CoA dehydrogenase